MKNIIYVVLIVAIPVAFLAGKFLSGGGADSNAEAISCLTGEIDVYNDALGLLREEKYDEVTQFLKESRSISKTNLLEFSESK